MSVLVGLESINEQTKIETSGEVGFCPQFDFLWPQLTVREHLRLRLAFSSKSRRARNNDEEEENIPSSEPILIQTLASKLAISNKLDEQISTLSGGQKRKVSLLLSLLNSSIAILDEPTASMDPVSKRLAWKLISEFTKSDSANSVVLATHHMDEVEALADDLVILHNGQSVIESVSVEEMKKMHGGGGDEPSLEKAFLNFIAKAKEEEGEEDDIILPLEEVGVAAATSGDIDNNDDEKTTKTRRALRQVQAILRARYFSPSAFRWQNPVRRRMVHLR